jgi:hypothetical protein
LVSSRFIRNPVKTIQEVLPTQEQRNPGSPPQLPEALHRADPGLLYPEILVVESPRPQEVATLPNACKVISTLEPF